MRYFLMMLIPLGCSSKSGSSGPCFDLCQELVQTCGYAAYPTFTSCEEGCLYYEEQGSDIDSHLTCVQEAECNEFDVIECAHKYGESNANQ